MGRLTFPEICAEVRSFSSRDLTSKVLCDLTRGTVSDLTSKEIEGILEILGQKLESGSGGKAAIVALAGVDYGLARMFGTFAEIANLPIEVKVFRTYDIARQWLQGVEPVYVSSPSGADREPA
jgi:hypothetical protein